jgi:hypothetical protein
VAASPTEQPPLNESTAAPADLARRPLWICPRCGNAFANRNSWHSCISVPLEDHFAGRPKAREIFDRLRSAVESIGPVWVVSSKTRIGFMTRVRFAGVYFRRDGLRLAVWLRRRVDSPRVAKVEYLPTGNWIHHLDLRAPGDVDEEVLALIREARLIGDQRHHTLYRAR